MRTDEEIEMHISAIVRCILMASNGISEQEARLLAYKGLLRYDDLFRVREMPLALDLIADYAKEHGKDYHEYWKTKEEWDEYDKVHHTPQPDQPSK